MNAKRIAAAVALACVLRMAGSAQAGAAQAGAAKIDTPLISIENGYAIGYNLSSNDFGSSFDLSIGLGVADRLQLYFTNLAGDGGTIFPAYRLFSVAYTIAPRIGVSTFLGRTGTTNVVGLGLFSAIFEREVGGLTTSFKLRLDYITPMTDFAAGMVRVDLLAGIGI